MSSQFSAVGAARGANVLVTDHFCIGPGECVLVTADGATDPDAAAAILAAAAAVQAKPVLVTIPQLPYQGKLADPHVPDALAAAVMNCDVWFDMTFPYLAGSEVHDRAMKAGRARYLLVGDIKADGVHRLYGTVPLDRLFEVQQAFDHFMASHEGAQGRITSPHGTDITFTLGRSATRKHRRTDKPGTSTIMGSGIFYPVPESVRGTIAIDAIFHEYYKVLPAPMLLVVDGNIRELRNAGADRAVTERALRRAGGGSFGRVIHLTYGFHPSAQFTGRSFIEDIRSTGSNAVGLGVPWWEPGGGENHPDAVMSSQSIWVDGELIVENGALTGPLKPSGDWPA